MSTMRANRRFLVLFLAPAGILYTCFVAFPGARALLYSLQKWDGFREIQWAGLDNFRALFRDGLFLEALKHNAILLVFGGTLTISMALFFAAALNRRVFGSQVFRVAFFFPNVLASVAVAVLWLQLYSTNDFGVFNAALHQTQRTLDWAGIPFMEEMELPYAFLKSSRVIYAIIPMLVWIATGFYMVLFLAAMEGIHEELYEAARIDGANPVRQFFSITLPLIREVFVVAVVFFIIASAKFFDPVWVMENSYPTEESHVMATVLYQKVFTEYNVGYAAAVAVVLFTLIFIATLITLRWSRKEALEF